MNSHGSSPGDMETCNLSVAIPTFGRDQVLLDTLAALIQLRPQPLEILVLDQTPEHEPATESQLGQWHEAGLIDWIRLPAPSITGAMNHALQVARGEMVLFTDDDVVPDANLFAAHLQCYEDATVTAVVGQVLQPGQSPCPPRPGESTDSELWHDLDFPFNGTQSCLVHNCMAGNLSVRRSEALRAGGFDENFVRVAYRFETEFARRLIRHGGKILFQPAASLRHLACARGGVRSFGSFLTTFYPHHAVGDYYFALNYGLGKDSCLYILWRLRRRLFNRTYARRPWWIPVAVFVEISGFFWAVLLRLRGPRLLNAVAEDKSPTPQDPALGVSR